MIKNLNYLFQSIIIYVFFSFFHDKHRENKIHLLWLYLHYVLEGRVPQKTIAY